MVLHPYALGVIEKELKTGLKTTLIKFQSTQENLILSEENRKDIL